MVVEKRKVQRLNFLFEFSSMVRFPIFIEILTTRMNKYKTNYYIMECFDAETNYYYGTLDVGLLISVFCDIIFVFIVQK